MTEATEQQGPKTAKRVEGISQESKLTVIATTNPKREGSQSFDRFEGYFNLPEEATVKDALDAGLTMGDIRYDIIHGSIAVEGAEVTEYEVTPRGEKATEEADDTSDDGFGV